MMKPLVLLVISLGVGIGRFFIPKHGLSLPGTYEAFAHLFVGGLIGVWLATKNKTYLYLVLSLSAVELFAFLFT